MSFWHRDYCSGWGLASLVAFGKQGVLSAMVEREEPGKVARWDVVKSRRTGLLFLEECPSVETSDPMDHCTPREITQGDKILD